MAQLAPRFLIEQNDDDEREGEFGNPDLDPYVAWNFDASVEWYFSENAVLQGGVFYKDVEDYIVITIVEDFDFNGVFVNEAAVPRNGDNADVYGVELNYQQALSLLPAPFDGLLVGVNYTYVDTQADYEGRNIDLPGSSKNVVNLALGYEKGPISLRLAWVYRDKYLDELSADGESDRYVKDHASLDLVAKYRVAPQMQLFIEAMNITDEPFEAYQDTPDYGDRVMQYEKYSYTVNLGLRATF
jgi:TonB-dependent receptor